MSTKAYYRVYFFDDSENTFSDSFVKLTKEDAETMNRISKLDWVDESGNKEFCSFDIDIKYPISIEDFESGKR